MSFKTIAIWASVALFAFVSDEPFTALHAATSASTSVTASAKSKAKPSAAKSTAKSTTAPAKKVTANTKASTAAKATKQVAKKPAGVQAKTAASKPAAVQTKSPATPAKPTATQAKSGKRNGKQTAKAAPSRPRSVQQQQPSSERYQEIQQALVDRGYLSGPADGNWGSDSVGGLKRFQADQSLTPDGKLTALSLTALGLGPRRQVQSVAPIQTSTAQPSSSPIVPLD
ncbi:MAG: peptidoglycan-binding protein [Acidobacteriota bacterium]